MKRFEDISTEDLLEQHQQAYVMTGSPVGFGYKTKAEFRASLSEGYVEVKKVEDADLLITDDLESRTSKMKKADKLGVVIKTYGTV